MANEVNKTTAAVRYFERSDRPRLSVYLSVQFFKNKKDLLFWIQFPIPKIKVLLIPSNWQYYKKHYFEKNIELNLNFKNFLSEVGINRMEFSLNQPIIIEYLQEMKKNFELTEKIYSWPEEQWKTPLGCLNFLEHIGIPKEEILELKIKYNLPFDPKEIDDKLIYKLM